MVSDLKLIFFSFFSCIILEHFQWTQTPSDLEITVPVNDNIKKGKQVIISCTKDYLNIVQADQDGTVLFDGPLSHSVKSSELMWTLMPGSHILINLEKAIDGQMWTKLLKTDTENISDVNYERPVSNMNESDKMAVEYALSQQKAKNETTDDDKNLEKLLKEAWNKEGSPFQGQPFNPSVLSNIKKSN